MQCHACLSINIAAIVIKVLSTLSAVQNLTGVLVAAGAARPCWGG